MAICSGYVNSLIPSLRAVVHGAICNTGNDGKQKDTRPKKDTPKRPYNVSIRATPNLAHSPTSAVVSGGPTYMTKKIYRRCMMALRVKEISAGIGRDRVFDYFFVVASFEGIYIYS